MRSRTVEELTGNEKKSTIQAAQIDDKFNLIIERFREKGWIADYENSICNRVIPKKKDPYSYIVVPLHSEDGDSDTQSNVFWSNWSLEDDSIPNVFGHKASGTPQKILETASESEQSTPELDITVYTVDNGQVITNHHSMSDEGGISTFDHTGPGPGGGGDGCVVKIVTCDSWDWSCIIAWASSAIGTVAAAGSCVLDPTKITCGLFLAAIAGGGATAYDCADGNFYEDECSTTYKWVPEEKLPEAYANSHMCV